MPSRSRQLNKGAFPRQILAGRRHSFGAKHKYKWILAALMVKPLDRIHIMEALFLLQRRVGGIPDFFQFEPFFYGPCSFEVYESLFSLERNGFVVRPLSPMFHPVVYYLTDRGKKEAEKAVRTIDPYIWENLVAVISEVGQLSLCDLLRKIGECYAGTKSKVF